jgi:RHS repeat-associated protein
MSGMLSGENFVQASLNNNRITGFSYDAPGNTVSDGINSYVYNAENQIVSAAGVAYTYDGGGDRVKKSSGRLYWSGALGIMAESDLSGNLAAEYMFFAGARVARRDLPSGAVHYYFSDRLKSTSVVSSALGVIEEESDYRPWGEERHITSNIPDQHFKFNGMERDSETGISDFGARFYSSTSSRWLTPDWSLGATPVPFADLRQSAVFKSLLVCAQ